MLDVNTVNAGLRLVDEEILARAGQRIQEKFEDEPERTAYTFDPKLDLSETTRALVNVGSVGQPRDENPEAAYAIWDTVKRRVTLHRVPYDIDTACAKIETAGLPQMLADRLRMGK